MANFYASYPIGAQGAQGSQGAQGNQGFQGVQGAQGFQGSVGSQGAQGFQGFQGVTGSQGAQGFQGFQGVQGAQGFQGVTGSQGAQGFQGTTGAQGSQGFQGSVGSQGAQGFQGVTGAQGAQGFQGSTGAQGAQGFQGTTGSQGAQGFQGSVGSQGAQGFQGVTGSQGAQGFQGTTGSQGAQGFQGSTGAQGAQGFGLDASNDIQNLTLQNSVAANALTIALKTKAATDPTSGDPVNIGFRDSTLSSGNYSLQAIGSARSIVVPDDATLGFTAGVSDTLYIYALYPGGASTAVVLAVAGTIFDETNLITTTAITGAADSRNTMYSTAAQTSVPFRLIGRFEITLGASNHWTATATKISYSPFYVQENYLQDSTTGANFTTSGTANVAAWTNGIPLGPGEWDLNCTFYIEAPGTTTGFTDARVAINSTAAISPDGISAFEFARAGTGFVGGEQWSGSISNFRVVLTTTTTYAAYQAGVWATTAPKISGRISARRVK